LGNLSTPKVFRTRFWTEAYGLREQCRSLLHLFNEYPEDRVSQCKHRRVISIKFQNPPGQSVSFSYIFWIATALAKTPPWI